MNLQTQSSGPRTYRARKVSLLHKPPPSVHPSQTTRASLAMLSKGTDERLPAQQRPCDACRRRKICCVRESETEPCSLCQMRSQQCTFLSRPNVRRRGPPAAQSGDSPGEASPGNEVVQRTEQEHVTSAEPHQQRRKIGAGELPDSWVSQFVGLSGDQDPYVLRHCIFHGDKYNSHSWSYLRVRSGMGQTPAHFTVRASFQAPMPAYGLCR